MIALKRKSVHGQSDFSKENILEYLGHFEELLQ